MMPTPTSAPSSAAVSRTAPPPRSRPRLPATAPLWLLVFVTLSGTLGMHMFVPALAKAAHDLHTSTREMQMTITLYIIGLAVGQLVYGPLSDAFGRRRLLLAGLTLYTLGGVAAALAPGVDTLVAARLLQALGGCAGLVLGRAIVRDSSDTTGAVRRLALLNLMVLVGPGLAPLVGGSIAGSLGWRSIFALLAGLGALALFCTARLLPETGQAHGRISTAILRRDYATLLRSREFCGFAIGGSCATTPFYGFLAAAPFVLNGELHRPVSELGLYMALLVGGSSVGNAMAGRLVRTVPLQRLLLTSNIVCSLASAALLAVVLGGQLTVASLIGLVFVFCLGSGLASPVAVARAISVNPQLTGSAAGMYGFVQMAVGAVATALVGLGSNPAVSAASVLLGGALLASLCFRLAFRR